MGAPGGVRLGWMLFCLPVITIATFVATYPYLWPAPLDRTKTLFEFRRDEMDNQARIWSSASVDSRLEAARRTWVMLEHRYSASGKVFAKIASALGHPTSERGIDVPFAVAGLLILAVLAYRRGITSPTFFAVAITGGQAALILGGLRVDFERYYLPVVFFFAIGIGTLGAWIWSMTTRWLPRLLLTSPRREKPVMNLNPRPAPGHQTAD
jgi:hypothetical protein